MELSTVISRLISARKLENVEDFETYEQLQNELYHKKKHFPLTTYFYGFDDDTQDDSTIFSFFESVFYYTKLPEFAFFDEQYIINQLINNIDIFLPHATEWYCNIINLLLYHYTDNPFNIILKELSVITQSQRLKIGNLLKQASKDAFIYDDNGRVAKEYQAIIDFCLK